MSINVEDRSGLNPTEVLDMPLMASEADAVNLRKLAVASEKQISLAGMRHSQGGQTSKAEAYMAVMETFNQVSAPQRLLSPYLGDEQVTHIITADAGAVWSQVHHALNPYGLAPLVHQSSAHFTIGGSISVNCHGRDHRWGALANTIVSMKVLTGKGYVLTASRTENEDLFKAVIGGYGSCGMILNATIAVTDNLDLQTIPLKQGAGEISIAQYVDHLHTIAASKVVMMHIGWLDFTDNDFFTKVAGYDFKFSGGTESNYFGATDKAQHRIWNIKLHDEDYGQSEIMRAGWHSAKKNDGIRKKTWTALKMQHASKKESTSRLNHLRAAISFTGYRGAGDADILLEYFVPIDQLVAFISACRTHYKNQGQTANVHISTGSIRLLQREDTISNLSYSRLSANGNPMVSVALDLNIPIERNRQPTQAVTEWVNALTDKALACDGTFYLPYFKFADNAQFKQAYNTRPAATAGYKAQLEAIKKFNPEKVYWNDFLEKYF